jgi:hypothetical protein
VDFIHKCTYFDCFGTPQVPSDDSLVKIENDNACLVIYMLIIGRLIGSYLVYVIVVVAI